VGLWRHEAKRSNEHRRRDSQAHNLASGGRHRFLLSRGLESDACRRGAMHTPVRPARASDHSTSLTGRGSSQWSSKGGGAPQTSAHADRPSSPFLVCSPSLPAALLPNQRPASALRGARSLLRCSARCALLRLAQVQSGRQAQEEERSGFAIARTLGCCLCEEQCCSRAQCAGATANGANKAQTTWPLNHEGITQAQAKAHCVLGWH